MRSEILERVCDACGVAVRDDAATVCVRCGAPLASATPTSVYAPPPAALREWIKASTEAALPRAVSSRTLIGVAPPRAGADPDTNPLLDARAARRLPSDDDVPTHADPLDASELLDGNADDDPGGGLPTMPIERLPSYPSGQLHAPSSVEVPLSRKEPRPSGGARARRALADTLPPPPASPVSGVVLSVARTEPDVARASAGPDPELTPPPLVEDSLLGSRGFDAFDEVSSPEVDEDAVTPPPQRGRARSAPALHDAADFDLTSGDKDESTADVQPQRIDIGRGGVSPWLLGLWVVAIAATVAAILVVLLR